MHSDSLDTTIRICPACGYGRGFHLYLEPATSGSGANIGLICPSCGQSYRLGWFVPEALGELRRGEVY